jgi:5'-methylthioadenosine phosphorylase
MGCDEIMSIEIGIIGGSGLYDMAELAGRGRNVDRYTVWRTLRSVRDRDAARQARRLPGAPRRRTPHSAVRAELRANIYGFKVLGAERILSASAVGSLKQEYKPLDIVVPDQFYDRTKGRISTFFGRGLVAHVAFAHPICGDLSAIAADSAEAVGATVHRGGTYVNMEGPQFSTLGRVEALSLVGHGRHRHDEPARKRSSRARRRSATPRWRSSPTTTAGTPTTIR